MSMESIRSDNNRADRARAEASTGARFRAWLLALPRWPVASVLGAAVVAGAGVYWAANAHGPTRSLTTAPSHPRRVARRPAHHVHIVPTSAPLALPVVGSVLAGYGWAYSSYLGEWYYNPGITLRAAVGTPVRAAWGGQVTAAGTEPGLGLAVRVADGQGYVTVYGNLGTVAVHPGETVAQGTVLGTVGPANLYSRQRGPHVDFQIWRGTTPVNPETFFKNPT
jgi:murein DD-endopeptidase MepM/ murein hydrolase activator NlpD